MADYTLGTDEWGLYELALAAETSMSVDVPSQRTIRIEQYSGEYPVYYAVDEQAVVKGRRCRVVTNGSFTEFYAGGPSGEMVTVNMISQAAAVVSVMRL